MFTTMGYFGNYYEEPVNTANCDVYKLIHVIYVVLPFLAEIKACDLQAMSWGLTGFEKLTRLI